MMIQTTPTQDQYDALARVFQAGYNGDGDSDGWEDLALDPKYISEDCLPVVTRDTFDDFRRAAETEWNEASKCEEIEGGLYWDRVQVRQGQPRVSLAVIDCGEFRLSYQLL